MSAGEADNYPHSPYRQSGKFLHSRLSLSERRGHGHPDPPKARVLNCRTREPLDVPSLDPPRVSRLYTPMPAPLVIAPGSINVDLVLKTDVLKGPKTFRGQYGETQGGKGSNQALAARRASADQREVVLVGCVGQDEWGAQALQVLEDSGITTDQIRVDETTRTGVVMEYLYGDGEVTIALDLGANGAVRATDIDRSADLIDVASLLLAQIETTLDALECAVRRARSVGVPTILDPSIIPDDDTERQRLMNDILTHVDVIAPNRSEALSLSGVEITDDTSALAAADVIREHVPIVVITRGADGAVVVRGQDHQIVQGLRVDAIDGGAAGDTFRGAFAMAIAEARDATSCPLDELPFEVLVQAAEFANAAAALCVTREGAAPSIPDRTRINQMLAAGTTRSRGSKPQSSGSQVSGSQVSGS